jgi:hypothetical protein
MVTALLAEQTRMRFTELVATAPLLTLHFSLERIGSMPLCSAGFIVPHSTPTSCVL